MIANLENIRRLVTEKVESQRDWYNILIVQYPKRKNELESEFRQYELGISTILNHPSLFSESAESFVDGINDVIKTINFN